MILPDIFAVLRTQSSRGPFWQIFLAKFSNQLIEVKSDDTVAWVDMYLEGSTSRPFRVHEGRFRMTHGEPRTIKFWYLPILLEAYGRDIPAIDFEYKSWLPSPTHRVGVRNPEEVKERYKTAYTQFQRYTGSSVYESISPNLFTSLPVRSPTPPRQSRPPSRESVESVESVMTIYQMHQEQRHEVSSIHKPLHLPDSVGSLLVQQAWSADESCPISAIPFKDLEQLSVTSCFHVFDAESLAQWRRSKDECPVCRCPITNVVNQRKN